MVFADPCFDERIAGTPPIKLTIIDAALKDESPSTRKVVLKMACAHKWLGIRLTPTLTFTAGLEATLYAASAALAPVIGFLVARAIPLHLAVAVFRTKVDSLVETSRCLHAATPWALERLSDANCSWARALLGAQPWRNATVCASELGGAGSARL